jgi:D-3-phosphoglycerate dehydrogenase
MQSDSKRNRVLFSQRFADGEMIAFFREHDVDLVIADIPSGKADSDLTPDDLASRLDGIDGWIVGHVRIDRSLLERIPSVKVIARRGVGYDKIDIAAAAELGKVVTISRGGNEEAVADHTIGLMLDVGRRISESHAAMKTGRWEILTGTDLFRKTIGLVGFGPIARNVARRLLGFEAHVLVSTPRHDSGIAEALKIEYTDLDRLLAESDYVSLHAPANSATHGMFDAAAFAKMKRNAFLINTARASLVEEAALMEALKAGTIAGAALDVLAGENDPVARRISDGLLSMPNVVVTPHSAASTREALSRTNIIAARAVVEILTGGYPPQTCIVADGRRRESQQ